MKQYIFYLLESFILNNLSLFDAFGTISQSIYKITLDYCLCQVIFSFQRKNLT